MTTRASPEMITDHVVPRTAPADTVVVSPFGSPADRARTVDVVDDFRR